MCIGESCQNHVFGTLGLTDFSASSTKSADHRTAQPFTTLYMGVSIKINAVLLT
ncbi:hypothetical protein PILCRDRAFT_814912 [Piloderma croceum F 1598]|uniref:Uncharacterized protein n=1 Tax=Piloderma croceum (strain F 1598) TaxID=765440 RepID=A0A0C3G6F4_PILCF|nr:hypothetical protein PILCRDRAFT_814912 [Piloderma croceum F 1598]